MNASSSSNSALPSDNRNNNNRKRDSSAIAQNVGSSYPDNPFKAPRRIHDDGPPPAEAEPKWRKDPKETYSDWKIEIIPSDQQDQVQTYHVHKFVLAVGRRKSDYFERLFQMESKFREGESCTSRIELEPLAAKAFPQLLDYVYDYEKPLNISIETATALHHLGEYFEMQNLRWDAKQYCKSEMTVDNVDVLYRHAVQFQDSSFLSMVAQFLGENVIAIDPKSCPIMQEPDPELWLNALQHVNREDHDAVLWSSKVIARFCDNHRHELDRLTFEKLTKESVLPYIHCNAALTLCKHDDRFLKELEANEEPPPEQEGVVWVDEITPLQERCASSLASLDLSQWDSFISNEHKIDKLRIRKACFLVDLIVKILREASAKQKEFQAEIEELRTILQNFHPINRNGRIVRKQETPLRPNEGIEVPAELQWARPDLGEKLGFGFQESLFPNSQVPCFPAFYYDPTITVEDSDSEDEGEDAGQDVLQRFVVRLQEAMPPEGEQDAEAAEAEDAQAGVAVV